MNLKKVAELRSEDLGASAYESINLIKEGILKLEILWM